MFGIVCHEHIPGTFVTHPFCLFVSVAGYHHRRAEERRLLEDEDPAAILRRENARQVREASDIARNERLAAESEARVQANAPRTAEEARRASALLIQQRAAMDDGYGTRGNVRDMDAMDTEITNSRVAIRRLQAEEREKHMWNPATFHRSNPTTLHRTPDRARTDPPPKTVQAICYVPREVARTARYLAPHEPDVAGSFDPTVGRIRTYVDADDTDPYDSNDGHPIPITLDERMKTSMQTVNVMASSGNVTWFTNKEKENPIHFWEQWVRCYHCGRDHFLPGLKAMHDSIAGMHLRCCKAGENVFDRKSHSLPDGALNMIGYGTGISSSSRAINEVRRLCAQALPSGTHRLVEAGGGAKITGVPYAVIPNVTERCAARMFLDDPSTRHNQHPTAIVTDAWARPRSMRVFDYMLYDNPLYTYLTMWHNDTTMDTYLGLKWEGTTNALRMFTVTPATANVTDRTVLVFSRSQVDKKKFVIKATHALYACVNWPLAFPSGIPSVFEGGAEVDQWLRMGGRDDGKDLNIQKTTLYYMLQPERRGFAVRGEEYAHDQARQQAPGSVLLVPTLNPYFVSFPGERSRSPYIWRRFNRFGLMGKLADEFVLDRWCSVMDHRRHILSTVRLQQRMVGQPSLSADPDVATNPRDANLPDSWNQQCHDAQNEAYENDEQPKKTYLPPSEDGSPRNQAEKTGDAMFLAHTYGSPLIFSTWTVDPHWPEIASRLPVFDPLWTDQDCDSPPKPPADVQYTSSGDVYKTRQNVHEATLLHAEVFEYKHKAFSAVMQSGTIFRNVGRPRIVGWRTEHTEDGEVSKRIPLYDYPLSIDRRDDGSQGWDADANEYQKRNFTHTHKATRPAKIPHEWNVSNAVPGQRLDWVDKLTCARHPDRSVLLQFGMLGTAKEWRLLDGICKDPNNASKGLYSGYGYLNAYKDDDVVVHPDIVHDFGLRFQDPVVLLTRLTRLVSGQAPKLRGCTVRIEGLTERLDVSHRLQLSHNGRIATVLSDSVSTTDDSAVTVQLSRLASDPETDTLQRTVPRAYIILVDGDPDHYSLHPYPANQSLRADANGEVAISARRGRMIHNHPKGMHIPVNNVCGKETCTKAHFPKPVSPYTTVNEESHLLYQRGPADRMVVAWNAWVTLYFEAHINVDVVVSSTNVIAYMFKLFMYIWKGVGNGDQNMVQFKNDDEIGEFFSTKETCGTEAVRRCAQMPSVSFTYVRNQRISTLCIRFRTMLGMQFPTFCMQFRTTVLCLTGCMPLL